MEPTAYARQPWNPEQNISQGSSARTSENDALLNAFAEKYREEGRRETSEKYQLLLDDRDKRIKDLEALLAQQKEYAVSLSSTLNASSTRTYNYNASCFPRPNGDVIIDVLIELTNSKREKGKYIINYKTDWYMVWKVLHYFKLYTGNEYDFIDIVNECVIPYIKDAMRRKQLTVSNSTFKAIKSTSPMKAVTVHKWRNELEKERERHAEAPTQHGTPALDRGLNIKVRLQILLQERHVQSINYET